MKRSIHISLEHRTLGAGWSTWADLHALPQDEALFTRLAGPPDTGGDGGGGNNEGGDDGPGKPEPVNTPGPGPASGSGSTPPFSSAFPAFGSAPAIPLRGFPDDARLGATSAWWIMIGWEDTLPRMEVTPETAADWVRSGRSRYKDDERRSVSNPDWHRPTWLSTSEFAGLLRPGTAPEYHALLTVMQAMESHGGTTARLIVWFDHGTRWRSWHRFY